MRFCSDDMRPCPKGFASARSVAEEEANPDGANPLASVILQQREEDGFATNLTEAKYKLACNNVLRFVFDRVGGFDPLNERHQEARRRIWAQLGYWIDDEGFVRVNHGAATLFEQAGARIEYLHDEGGER